MQGYGGKFQKKREETRERMLQEKISFIKIFFSLLSIGVLVSVGVYIGVRYFATESWNEDVLSKAKGTWQGLDQIETDVVNSVLFLKGCRRDIVFQETSDGFQLRTVENRTNSMAILQNIPFYSDLAIPAFLGAGVHAGDKLIQCSAQDEKEVEMKISRNNPKNGFDYLIMTEAVGIRTDIPSNLIKFQPVTYRWEKSDTGENLFRKGRGDETQILSNIESHTLDYSFKDGQDAYFNIEVVLKEKFPDGNQIHFKRNIPFSKFERLPNDLEGKVF